MSLRTLCGATLLLALMGCGGGDDAAPVLPAPPPSVTYTIGGTVAGLAQGSSLVLGNGSQSLTIAANGPFGFGTPLTTGSAYGVVISVPPTGQTCSVANGGGTISSNVTDVSVACGPRDTTPPTVTERSPAGGAMGSPLQGPVATIRFSEPLNPASVTSGSLQLRVPGGLLIPGVIALSENNTVATFAPNAALGFQTDYEVVLGNGIRDAAGNSLAPIVWGFNTGAQYSGGGGHTCARLIDGRVKCWGENSAGGLGYDDEQSRGNGVGPGTSSLEALNLGLGRFAISIAAGNSSTCALLDNGSVKCWGWNSSGQLGQGHTDSLGNQAGEMAALQPIDFGNASRVVELAAGYLHYCARFEDETLKCWGSNTYGQLGRNSIANLGNSPGDLAAAAPVNFGSGLKPRKIAPGGFFTCVIAEDAARQRHVRCWGRNDHGQLGRGNLFNVGDAAGGMESLAAIDLGTGRSPRSMVAGTHHACAILDNAAVKCWGDNLFGQLGRADGSSGPTWAIGDAPGEMGDALANVPVGPVAKLGVTGATTCANLSAGGLRCWGVNSGGEVGLATGAAFMFDFVGSSPGDVPNRTATSLPAGAVVGSISSSHGSHFCFHDTSRDRGYCWGFNMQGQLGLNTTAAPKDRIGDQPNEMGDALQPLDLGP